MAREERYKRKRGINVGAFIATVIIFLIAAVVMLWAIQVKAAEVTKTNSVLELKEQENKDLQLTIEKIQEENEEVKKEIEQLKEEMKDLELQMVSKREEESMQKIAYLTFDDGPSANTTRILDVLKEKNIPATFFVVGNQDMTHVYKRIVDEGHALGNHTYGHDYKGIYQNTNTFFADVDKLNDLLEEVTGQRSKILRFPGGSNNTVSRHAGGSGIMDVMIDAVTEEGYRYFDWNVDSADASKAKQSKDVIVSSVLNGSKGLQKAVILMHDAPAKTTTAEALPEIIEGLTKQGFIFKGLDMHSPEVQF